MCKNTFVISMPSVPPAQDPAMSAVPWASSASSVKVGTYGGLNRMISTECFSRDNNGRANDAIMGSSGTYLFCLPVARVDRDAWGLISVHRYKAADDPRIPPTNAETQPEPEPISRHRSG